MKGRISKRLNEILRDKLAREQLRNSLAHGGKGRVHLGDKIFVVQVEKSRVGQVRKTA